MSSRLLAVAYDAADAGRVAGFWAGVLGRQVVEQAGGALLPGADGQVGLRFETSELEPAGEHRLHLHLTSTSLEDQQRTVDTVLALGGRHADVGQDPDDDFVVLADPEGNLMCVIEPGNSFLAGTGRLGEVTCDGSRAVGVFWSEALGWPLVWDQDGETSVQSPIGGTKISWGGPPVAPKQGRNRQRFELTTDDVEAEADRLVALGATRLGHRLGDLEGGMELADPDGNEFAVIAGRPFSVE